MAPPKRQLSLEEEQQYGRHPLRSSSSERGTHEELPREGAVFAFNLDSDESRSISTRGEEKSVDDDRSQGSIDRRTRQAVSRRNSATFTSAQRRTSTSANRSSQAREAEAKTSSSAENVRWSSGEYPAGGSQGQSQEEKSSRHPDRTGLDNSAEAIHRLPSPPQLTTSAPSHRARAEESFQRTRPLPPDPYSATRESNHPPQSHSTAKAAEDTPTPLSSELPSSREEGRGQVRQLHPQVTITSSTSPTFSAPSSRSSPLPSSKRVAGVDKVEGEAEQVYSESDRQEGMGESSTSTLRYLLHFVQQPTTGSAFGSKLLSRLAIAPALVVQLQVLDVEGREVDIDDQLALLVCQISLRTRSNENADMLTPAVVKPGSNSREGAGSSKTPTSRSQTWLEEDYASPTEPDPHSSVRLLYGSLVASPRKLQLDVDLPRSAVVFIFPEVSIRSRGQYRLRVDLYRLNIPLPALSSSASPMPPSSASTSASASASSGAVLQPSTAIPTSSASFLAPSSLLPSSSSSSSSSPSSSTHSSLLASALTDVLTVVLPAQYVAPHVTDLSRHLASQGVPLILPFSSQMVE